MVCLIDSSCLTTTDTSHTNLKQYARAARPRTALLYVKKAQVIKAGHGQNRTCYFKYMVVGGNDRRTR
jgi:hypothetical protein